MQPSDLFNSIDLNGIPASLISSTEIITGGASAIYGSDALAGVINFQLRKNFSGIELDAQQGITDEGDGANFNIRSEEHTSELQSLMRSSYAVFCLKKKNRIIIYIKYYTRYKYEQHA